MSCEVGHSPPYLHANLPTFARFGTIFRQLGRLPVERANPQPELAKSLGVCVVN